MKPIEKQTALIENLKSRYNAEVENYKNLKLVTYTMRSAALTKDKARTVFHEDRPILQIFQGKAGNATSHYFYRTLERRSEAIANAKNNADIHEEYMQERKAEKIKSQENMQDVPVGAIFHSSWGYDQTNNNFYQVVDRPSKCFVTLREIAQTGTEANGPMSNNVKACPDEFVKYGEPTKPFRVKLQPNGSSIGVRINYVQHASLIDANREFYNSWYH